MKGNWTGSFQGTNTGQIVVEMDDRGDHFQGCAYAYDDTKELPRIFARIVTQSKRRKQKLEAPLAFLDPRSGEPCHWGQIAGLYQSNVAVPTSAQIEVEWDRKFLRLKWRTNIGTHGHAELARNKVEETSEIVPEPIDTWADFKNRVLALEPLKYAFRGQSKRWRLRTPFHRTGRGDLQRFFNEDVIVLHRHLSARTDHLFNLSDPLQYAAFLNLAQHHGYPTPLLDWTYSPFVAAYFAYRRAPGRRIADNKVRILMLDKAKWCEHFDPVTTVTVRWPHFSIVEPLPIANERLVPQQALSSFTTVDDIESYIRSKEQPDSVYLRAFDLPSSDHGTALRELSMMGIGAGSLFPGLDGICEEIRARFFGS